MGSFYGNGNEDMNDLYAQIKQFLQTRSVIELLMIVSDAIKNADNPSLRP